MTKQSFSPTDKPRRAKAAPGSPMDFLGTMRSIQALVERVEADELYPTVYDQAYSTVKGQSYEARITGSDSDPSLDAASDLAYDMVNPKAPVDEDTETSRPNIRSRSASAARIMLKDAEDALRLLRHMERMGREELGAPKRGRRSKWVA